MSKLLSTILQPRHVHQVEAGAPDGEGHREQGVRVRGEQELQDLLNRPAEAQWGAVNCWLQSIQLD